MNYVVFLRQWWGMSLSFPYAIFDHFLPSSISFLDTGLAWSEIHRLEVERFKKESPGAFERQLNRARDQERQRLGEIERAHSQGRQTPRRLFELSDWNHVCRAAGWLDHGERPEYGNSVPPLERAIVQANSTPPEEPTVSTQRTCARILPADPGPLGESFIWLTDDVHLAIAVAGMLNHPMAGHIGTGSQSVRGRLGVANVASVPLDALGEILAGIESATSGARSEDPSHRWAKEGAALRMIESAVRHLSLVPEGQLMSRLPGHTREMWKRYAPQWLAEALTSVAAEGDAGSASEPNNKKKSTPKKRGRRTASDPNEDRRIAADWRASSLPTIAEFSRQRGLDADEVRRAIDRDRHTRTGSSEPSQTE